MLRALTWTAILYTMLPAVAVAWFHARWAWVTWRAEPQGANGFWFSIVGIAIWLSGYAGHSLVFLTEEIERGVWPSMPVFSLVNPMQSIWFYRALMFIGSYLLLYGYMTMTKEGDELARFRRRVSWIMYLGGCSIPATFWVFYRFV